MDLATAAGTAVERVNGIPAPLALGLTVAGCLIALVWVIMIIVRDAKKDKQI